MKLTYLALLAALVCAGNALAQNTNITAGGFPTNAPSFDTNAVITGASGSAVAGFALSLLPYWDKTMTNAYGANELELEVSPTWKSAAASGSTPYLSIGANYFITKYFGFGGDMLTFGTGNGASDLDSGHAYAILRKNTGNVAAFMLLGGGRDKNRNEWLVEAGGGLEFRYSTGVGLLVDTRYARYVANEPNLPDHEFITRVGVTIHF